MNASAVAVDRCGLVTAVGMTAPQCCAAFRAKVTNPTKTGFIDADGEWLMGHEVALDPPLRGLPKLVRMAALAIVEALADVPSHAWSTLPLILCVAEEGRPGRTGDLDRKLRRAVEEALEARFHDASSTIAQGRVSVASAFARASELLRTTNVPGVVVAAADSLLSWPGLSHYDAAARLLRDGNSDGFMPGEGAGALLLRRPTGDAGELLCTGLGFGHEPAHVDSGEPLRAQGLSQAFAMAVREAGLTMHDVDLRISDLSGEQYYFKEATLALSRTLRKPKHALDIWHPAECTGEVGAVAGFTSIALAKAACDKRFVHGRNILVHLSNDDGARAALALQHRRAA